MHTRSPHAITLAALLTAAAALLAACSSTPNAPANAFAGRNRDSGLVFGSLTDEGRRGEGSQTRDAFKPIDFPDPNPQRAASGAPGPGYWQQRADYDIDLVLNTVDRSIDASMNIIYHNNSPDTLAFVWIQLEQNLLRPGSISKRVATSTGRVSADSLAFEGGVTLSRVRVSGTPAEPQVFDTLARIDLPQPLAPGQRTDISMDFDFPIAEDGVRHGWEEVEQGIIFELAQWFPHVCVYDDVYGWNTLPYLGPGEFYTNFGDYEVSITVPPTFTVAATGVLQNPGEVLSDTRRSRLAEAATSDEPVWIIRPEEVPTGEGRPSTNDQLTWTFAADDVRTFAFAASDAFIWDAARAIAADRDKTRDVLVQSLYPKEARAWLPTFEAPAFPADPTVQEVDGITRPREDRFDQGVAGQNGGSTRYTKHAIEFYSEFMDLAYPYPQMTNVNGPEFGMEYPMIMFCGARTSPYGLFGVTDHEVAHTWFPMVVNTDERRHIWMDEGFNVFVNNYSEAAWYGIDPPFHDMLPDVARMYRSSRPQPIVTPPDQYWPGWRGRLGYRKPGYGLALLREVILGPQRFDLAWQTYFDRWAFKSPRPRDFFRTMEDAAGADLGWFWRGWFYETGRIDLAVTGVGPAAPANSDRMSTALAARDNAEDFAVINFELVGAIPMPFDYEITYEDGTTQTLRLPVEAWAPSDEYAALVRTDGRTITKVQIDPGAIIPDHNANDNIWTR